MPPCVFSLPLDMDIAIIKKKGGSTVKTEMDKFSLLLGAAHFAVDFICTLMLAESARQLTYWQVMACAVLYNGLAFAFQLPIGALADRLKLSRGLAAVGCLMVAAGALLPVSLAANALMGLGNACFHVGGGREALKRGGDSAGIVGKFVAPGAVGIFLGPRLAGLLRPVRGMLPLMLVLLAAMLLKTRTSGREAEAMQAPGGKRPPGKLVCVCVCMFLTVFLRAYLGSALAYPFLSQAGWAFLFTLCIFGGKYFGGILADRFGTLRFCILSQLLGTVLFVFSTELPWLGMPAVFLFNTTMAVTATRLYRCAPGLPGTMFGLTTVALYLGALPRLMNLLQPVGLGLLSGLSTVLLVLGLMLSEGGDGHGRRDCEGAGTVAGTDAGH